MENNIWSRQIQGIQNLDLSREFRFRDDRKELFLYLLGLREGMTILDVGCGPGTLTRKFAKWLGSTTKIIGIDRDLEFIRYAQEKADHLGLTNLVYLEGDALDLPLADNSVDACLSHTVIEHVPNKEFLLEQKRVCRSGGRVSVLWTRPEKCIRTEPDQEPKPCRRESELLDKLFADGDRVIQEFDVGKYWPDPVGLPKLFERLGFGHIQVDAVAIPVVADDSRNSVLEKTEIILASKKQLLESIEMTFVQNQDRLSNDELAELKRLVSKRVAKRLRLMNEGNSIWDYSIVIMQIV